MLQPNSSVLSTVSPPESGFHPRREFVRDSHISSTFSLLSIANVGSVRLTSFASEVISTLGRYFEARKVLLSVREEPKLNVIEFRLDGKPWAQSKKTADGEKLFLDIMTIVFQQGYRFLSTIDYGRESSERVSIAFSKPHTLSPFEATRVPFALSFPSSTVLRVVNAPLNSSPAILQAARSAWPRGVVSEKKISEQCFEFRLKGYKWFQEDNFASDSLQHILSLLNALDRYAFSLLTSISLSGNHHRVKDLWIFSGSPLEASSDQSASGSNLELSGSSPAGSKFNVDAYGRNTPSPLSNKSVDAAGAQPTPVPVSPVDSSHKVAHGRSATEPANSLPARASSLLRKKPTQRIGGTALSVTQGYRRSSEEFPVRHQQNLAARARESMDMTGVGSATQPRFFRSQSGKPVPTPNPPRSPGQPRSPHENAAYLDLTQERPRVKKGDIVYETTGAAALTDARRRSTSTPELDGSVRPPRYPSPGGSSSESRPSSRQLTPRDILREPSDMPRNVGERVTSEARTESSLNILGPTAFRDSEFSSSTSHSYEIPIAWTGPDGEKEKESGRREVSPSVERDSLLAANWRSSAASEESKAISKSGRPSPMPKFPGAWQPTPIEEKPEEQFPSSPVQVKDVGRQGSHERKEVDAERTAAPTVGSRRQSEVALYGMAPKTQRPSTEQPNDLRTSASSPTKADGWVLVNVADDTPDSPGGRRSSSSRATSPQRPGASLSPIAKAIVIQDSPKPASPESKEKGASGIRRLFSRSKTQKLSEKEGRSRKSSLRDRWRKKTSDSA